MATTLNHDNRGFARMYDRISRSATFREEFDPWRMKLIAQARGDVLELGAGGGQNFVFYDPAITTRVTATEPNRYMRERAATAVANARVPITLIDAAAESLPFADATFDTAIATLVFCSVDDPDRALREIARVLKPEGTLLLFEHIRSDKRLWSLLQDLATPVQRRFAGNCHLNRDTVASVRAAGFSIISQEPSGGTFHPQVALVAQRTRAS